MKTYDIDLPYTFCVDHEERELPSGTFVQMDEKRRLIRRRCTAPELREWLSDATHYSDCASYGWNLGSTGKALGLQSSARATVKRVLKVLADNDVPVKGEVAEYTVDLSGDDEKRRYVIDKIKRHRGFRP